MASAGPVLRSLGAKLAGLTSALRAHREHDLAQPEGCQCAALPEVFYIADGHRQFERSLKELDKWDWLILCICPVCDALWVLDERDHRYTNEIASRLRRRDEWKTPVPWEQRKQLLLDSSGGTVDETCMWEVCAYNRVKGFVFCIDHLWERGVRRPNRAVKAR